MILYDILQWWNKKKGWEFNFKICLNFIMDSLKAVQWIFELELGTTQRWYISVSGKSQVIKQYAFLHF